MEVKKERHTRSKLECKALNFENVTFINIVSVVWYRGTGHEEEKMQFFYLFKLTFA